MKKTIIALALAFSLSTLTFSESLDVQAQIKQDLKSASGWRSNAWSLVGAGAVGISYGGFMMIKNSLASPYSNFISLDRESAISASLGIGVGAFFVGLGSLCGLVAEGIEQEALSRE